MSLLTSPLFKRYIEPNNDFYGSGFANTYSHQRLRLRGLMNLHLPEHELDPQFYELQDRLLQIELMENGYVDVMSFASTSYPKIALYQGDITRLKADAIVNAANSELLGCFVPGHNCVDNCIHSAAGLQLRDECYQLMKKQGHDEEIGTAKITKAYNLPAKYVIHTVGPVVYDRPTTSDQNLLAACYKACLSIAERHGCKSIVFPCISTGVFNYPNRQAAQVAVETVDQYQALHSNAPIVVFNTFKDLDEEIYEELLY